MVNYDIPLFLHPAETWNKVACDKAVRHVASDGCGTKYPWPGYIGSHYGAVRYNGGCIRNDEWYQGEEFPLPIIPPEYSIVKVPTWGYRIIKNG